MIKKITQISCTIAIALFLVSCKNTKQKIQEYVNTFNNSSALFHNDIISSASAKAFLNENKVEIRIDTNLEQNESSKSIYNQMFPALLGEMLKSDRASMELIREGVTFEMFFLANNSTILAELKVDEKELNKILSKNNTPAVDRKELSSSGMNPEMQQMLAIMNQNMPIVNEDGTKIIKIEISDKNELVYKIEVPKKYSELLKGEGAKVLMKESILRSSDLKTILGSIQRYNITTIKYLYQDAKGNLVNDIILTEKDLK
ncbi:MULTISPECIES: hypothetical protein [Flavobacterium]|uniref:Lipoprotein n=1 Tax=Flavobacterium panici TaxID=2654843 RepID=A0A9N8J5M0_9FLAO|nr:MULTISPECIES: hypothetical protein [Flavobacterium]UUF12155.1 hypothetical protein NLJ00_12935 [Flavobacterium panici]CAC9976700.1 hypothetical protein FLAPXU55_04428 [Flavobacterium panici]